MCVTAPVFKLPKSSGISEWSMTFHAQLFDRGITIPILQHESFLGLYFNLGSEHRYEILGLKPGNIYKDHYNLIHLPKGGGVLPLTKGMYSSLCVQFSVGYMKQFSKEFPLLLDLIKCAETNTPILLSNFNLLIMPEILDNIREILKNNQAFNDEQGEVLLQSRMMGILISCLQHIHHQLRARILNSEISKINKGHDYIIKNLGSALTVSWLADMLNMDVRRFEKGFKIVYGKTVYQFLIDARLRKAVDLLKDTELLTKEVAQAVGYKAVKKFSVAFKKRYGYPPSSVRKWGTNNPSNVNIV